MLAKFDTIRITMILHYIFVCSCTIDAGPRPRRTEWDVINPDSTRFASIRVEDAEASRPATPPRWPSAAQVRAFFFIVVLSKRGGRSEEEGEEGEEGEG